MPKSRKYWWIGGIAGAVIVLSVVLYFNVSVRRVLAVRQSDHILATLVPSFGDRKQRQVVDQGCQEDHTESLILTASCTVWVRNMYAGSGTNLLTNPTPGKEYLAFQTTLGQKGWHQQISSMQLPKLSSDISILGGSAYSHGHPGGDTLYLWYGMATADLSASDAKSSLHKGQVVYGVEIERTYHQKVVAP